MSVLLKSFMVVLGIILFGNSMVLLAKRKMTDQFCMMWSLLGGILVIGGLFLNPNGIEHYISRMGLILVLIAICGVIWGMWFMTRQISSLMRKNQELAMQVSLMNFDYDRLRKELEALKVVEKTEKTE